MDEACDKNCLMGCCLAAYSRYNVSQYGTNNFLDGKMFKPQSVASVVLPGLDCCRQAGNSRTRRTCLKCSDAYFLAFSRKQIDFAQM
ncbi:hypothetical protein Q1695_003239 [Nippostrongylus brasiliensis]|nr:hypothetical protein Q1695_003237 [Nippostrongylus brasiliensis]WKY11511.1 hypothetical protein Q1695_003239 [Nippostrongylus brasiliensis]